jgi:hypothetical protein
VWAQAHVVVGMSMIAVVAVGENLMREGCVRHEDPLPLRIGAGDDDR